MSALVATSISLYTDSDTTGCRTWMFVLAQSLCTCAGTITYFIPTLMAALGYKGHEIQYVSVSLEHAPKSFMD